MFRIYFYLIFILFNVYCTRSLSPSEYQKYIDLNRKKYSFSIERNGIRATITHFPSLYYSARDMISDQTLSIESAIERYSNSVIFIFSVIDNKRQSGSVLLERKGAGGFSQSVYKNTFERGSDIFLFNEKDTIKTIGCQYERNWGITNEDIFVITFPKSRCKKVNSYKLRIRDITADLGTIEISIKKIIPDGPNLRGL